MNGAFNSWATSHRLSENVLLPCIFGCHECEDNLAAGNTDFGCEASTPACDDTDADNPTCVQCLDSADCATGLVCNLGTKTCVPCTDLGVGAVDDNCAQPSAVCNETATGGLESHFE